MVDKALLNRMDKFEVSGFEKVKLRKDFFLLLLNLTKWINSRITWNNEKLEFANSVLEDLEAALNNNQKSAEYFCGDYADNVYEIYGNYDHNYERLTVEENAVLVWGYVFEICRNLVALHDIESGKDSSIYMDGEFNLKWMLPLIEAVSRTKLVTQESVQEYFDKFISSKEDTLLDLNNYNAILELR